MDSAAIFAAVYATGTELAALAISRLGVVSARRQPGGTDGAPMSWPHSGSVALHRAVAAVATTAACVLAIVFGALHHTVADIAVLTIPVILGVLTLTRLRSTVSE